MTDDVERRVLVIDDDALILRAVERSLRARGFVVTTSTAPASCPELLRDVDPHAVISDLHMPGDCGARVIADVATRAPGTLRILMSADPQFEPKIGSLEEASAHALLSKSSMSKLARLLSVALEARRCTTGTPEELTDLAERLGREFARPAHEDDGHRMRLSLWTERLLALAGATEDERATGALAGFLHDVGNLAIPEHVFDAGRLGSAARAELARHPELGARLVLEVPSLARTAQIVRHHHERWAGGGYPSGLEGRAIPLGARALHVVDAYDAMTQGRRYRAARTHDEAIAELNGKAGLDFDADLVAAFVTLDLPAIAVRS